MIGECEDLPTPLIIKKVLSKSFQEAEISEEDKQERCIINKNTCQCTMKLDCLLTPVIRIANHYYLAVDISLDNHELLGMWLTVKYKDAHYFYETFVDKDFYDKWDEAALTDILSHKPGMSIHQRIHETRHILQ